LKELMLAFSTTAYRQLYTQWIYDGMDIWDGAVSRLSSNDNVLLIACDTVFPLFPCGVHKLQLCLGPSLSFSMEWQSMSFAHPAEHDTPQPFHGGCDLTHCNPFFTINSRSSSTHTTAQYIPNPAAAAALPTIA
jgi:hypothetical protein